MKKIYLSMCAALILMTPTSSTFAKTVEEVQAEISAKQSELANLYTELHKLNNSKAYKIGETVMYASGLAVTITGVEISNEEVYGKINGTLVKVSFTVDNQSKEETNFSSHAIQVYDGARVKSELNSKNYYSEKIAQGMKGEGVAYFDVKNLGELNIKVGVGNWVAELKE